MTIPRWKLKKMFNVIGGVNYALFLPSVKKTMEEKKPFCKKNN